MNITDVDEMVRSKKVADYVHDAFLLARDSGLDPIDVMIALKVMTDNAWDTFNRTFPEDPTANMRLKMVLEAHDFTVSEKKP